MFMKLSKIIVFFFTGTQNTKLNMNFSFKKH